MTDTPSPDIDAVALEAATRRIAGTRGVDGRVLTMLYNTAETVAEQAIPAYLSALKSRERAK